MKLVAGFTSLAIASLTFGALVACGGPSTDDAVDRLKNPSGSFTKDNGNTAVTNFNTDKKSSSFSSGASKSGGGVNAKFAKAALVAVQRQSGLRLLEDVSAGADLKCDAGGSSSVSCTCAGGGSAELSVEQNGTAGGSDFEIKIDGSYSNCKMGDVTMDAKMAMVLSSKPIVEAKKIGQSKASAGGGLSGGLSFNTLVAINGTITDASGAKEVKVAMVTQGTAIWISVTVPDGSVTMGLDGTAIEVKAKDRTVICDVTSGKFSCKVDGKETETFDFSGSLDGAKEVSTTTPATTPSAPSSTPSSLPTTGPDLPDLPDLPSQ
jgi:hypothetical protein